MSPSIPVQICRACGGADFTCPNCGEHPAAGLRRPPAAFPLTLRTQCSHCLTPLDLLAIGWRDDCSRPPSLSDPLPIPSAEVRRRLESTYRRPPAPNFRPDRKGGSK